MQKSLLKLLSIVALTGSVHAYAVGMGGINVTSALGQPLKAEIELVVTSKADKASMVGRLASPDAYKKAGIEYPFNNKFKVQVENRANGEAYLQVNSEQAISDPYVSLLVEVSWASGKLLREYTFLLDPPGYTGDQPKAAEVDVAAPITATTLTDTPAPAAISTPAVMQDIPFTNTLNQWGEMAAPALSDDADVQSMTTESIVVQRGDTLNKIAAQNKPEDISLEQMLVALYRANTEQFDGKNMNRVKTGKILRMPDQSEMMATSDSDAKKEIRAQVKDWNAYRQKLAGAAPVSRQTEAPQQVSSGKITSSVVDKAPVAKESAKEVLKLSKGDEVSDKVAAGGNVISEQDKKNAAQEDAIAQAKATKEAEMRTALLEKNVQDLRRLAELKSEMAAMATPASAVTNASEVVAVPAPVVQPKPKVVAKKIVAEPSLLDQLLAEPLYLGGAAAAILGLGGLGFALSRRKKERSKIVMQTQADLGVITGSMSMPVAPSPDTGDFTAGAASKAEVAASTNDVDPISEADLFLSFGRDAQAEEILKEALQNTPNNHQIALKLIGIYANRGNVNDFATVARQLKASGDESAWQKAAAMGRKLEPNNPMYGSAGAVEDADSATMQTAALSPTTDFVLDAPADANAVTEVDFDLATNESAVPMSSGTEKTMILSAGELAAARAMDMDFDVSTSGHSVADIADAATMDFDLSATGTTPVSAEPASVVEHNMDDLVFDMPISTPEPDAAKPAMQADSSDMPFTLDFPTESNVEKPAMHAAEIGLADISLNLDDMPSSGGSAGKDEHWQEVATKLDLAKAYQEMGDQSGAREILEEVLREGDTGQREAAQVMLEQLV